MDQVILTWHNGSLDGDLGHHTASPLLILPMSTISAIYLRLPNWIGDVCMSLPCLDLLLESNLPVVVCARPWARDLLSAYPTAGFIPMSGRWRPDSLSSAMTFRFAGIPCAGHRDDGRSLILRWPITKSARRLHAVEAWYRLTRQALKRWDLDLGQDRVPSSLGLRLTDDHHETAQLLMDESGIQPGRFVLIAPTAVGLHHGKNKVWPHFEALTQRLQTYGYTVVMCPPPAEAQQAFENAPSAQCLPPVGLGAFATLTQHASLVICNDSGVSHIAAAAGARQLTLFGVTQQERTGPWSANATCLGSAKGWPGLEETERQALHLIQSYQGD